VPQRRAERQRIERGKQHGNGDRDRELLVQLPVIPGMNAVGTKTAERPEAMPTTGPDSSSIALKRRCLRRQALLDVAFNPFDHDNGVGPPPDRSQAPDQTEKAC